MWFSVLISSGVVTTSFDSNETGWTTVMRGGAPIQLGARPVEREGSRLCAGVLTGDHLRPGMERGICTDALMPGRTVREDDRPLCRYAYGSSEDRVPIPAGGVAVVTHAGRRT